MKSCSFLVGVVATALVLSSCAKRAYYHSYRPLTAWGGVGAALGQHGGIFQPRVDLTLFEGVAGLGRSPLACCAAPFAYGLGGVRFATDFRGRWYVSPMPLQALYVLRASGLSELPVEARPAHLSWAHELTFVDEFDYVFLEANTNITIRGSDEPKAVPTIRLGYGREYQEYMRSSAVGGDVGCCEGGQLLFLPFGGTGGFRLHIEFGEEARLSGDDEGIRFVGVGVRLGGSIGYFGLRQLE